MPELFGQPRLIARLAIVVGALLLSPTSSASAELRWQQVQEVADGPSVWNPKVAVSARGDALAVWNVLGSNEVHYAWRGPHGGWGTSRSLPGAASSYPAVAVSPRGIATVAYGLTDGRVGIADGQPGQALSLTEALGTPGPEAPEIGDLLVDDEAGATVGWTSHENVNVATRLPGRAFGSPQRLNSTQSGSHLRLAVNPAGAAVVAWVSSNPSTRAITGNEAAYRLPGARAFGPPEVPAVPLALFGLHVAIDAAGTAIVASSASPFFGPAGTSLSVRPPVGSFGPPQKVAGARYLSALTPEPDGSLSLIADRDTQGGRSGGVSITRRSASGTLGEPFVLTDDPRMGVARAVAGPAGDLLVTYARSPSTASDPAGAELRLRRSATAGFDAPVEVAGSFGTPVPGLTGSGEGIIVFPRNLYAAASMALEDLDRPVPPLPTQVQIDARSLALGRDGKVGLKVRCPVNCMVRPTAILVTKTVLTRSGRAATRRLRAKKRTRLRVRFSRRPVAHARRAMRSGQRVTLSYTVTTTGRSARGLTQSRMVRLRLKR